MIRSSRFWEQTFSNVIECFHMTSQRPYWCPKTMKRQPCWCPKPVLWELNSFLMQTLSFVPINLHRCWPREWKHSIGNRSNSKRARTKFKLTGTFKILRKLKQQKAFLACSLWFFAHLFVFVRKARGKVIIKKIQGFETEHKHLSIKYQIQNVRVQRLN